MGHACYESVSTVNPLSTYRLIITCEFANIGYTTKLILAFFFFLAFHANAAKKENSVGNIING